MKLTMRLIVLAAGFGFAAVLSSCESTGTGSSSNTHEMGGPRTPRMSNKIMPGRS